MQQYLKLAWRNLWRNKRRTYITLASVLLAVLLAICMRSLQKGTYANMISNSVRFSTGYIQIHAHGYWGKPSINNSFLQSSVLDMVLDENKNISIVVPRLQVFLLAASGNHFKGIELIGTDPAKEDEMNHLAKRIKAGSYLSGNSNGILIGDGIANYLNLSLGDSLLLMGQGYGKARIEKRFPITGIFHFPDSKMNNELVYITLDKAQDMLAARGRCTSISLMLKDQGSLDVTRKMLAKSIDTAKWEVMSWQAMNKSLTQEIAGDNAGGIIMLGILYLVVAFGVFGTILMMIVERRKEFAIMLSLGMKRVQLINVALFETLIIGLIGIITGMVLTCPILAYFHSNPIKITGEAAKTFEQFGIEPIMPASLDPSIFINQGLIVLVISLLASVYPVLYIKRFNILTALKQ